MIVLVDLDDVVADWKSEYNRQLDLEDPKGEITRTAEQRTFNLFHERPQAHQEAILRVMNAPGFYRDLGLIKGAREALRALESAGHIVYLVSSPFPSNSTCASDKFDWVFEHLGVEWVARLILTLDKTAVHGDILIDDKPEVLGQLTPKWDHVVFDQPWNQHVTGKRRLLSWDDIDQVLCHET